MTVFIYIAPVEFTIVVANEAGKRKSLEPRP